MNTKSIAAVALLATVAAATETVTFTNVTFTTTCQEDKTVDVVVPFTGACTTVCDVNSVSINSTGYATYYPNAANCKVADGTTAVEVQLNCSSTEIIPATEATALKISDASCGNETVVTPDTSSQGSSAASVFVSFALVAASVVAALL